MSPFPQVPALTLLAEGGVFLADSATLVVADVHLGKSAAFRAQGLPVPEGDNARDLQRLLDLVRRCRAAQLVVAGDLFHAPSSITASLETALAEFLNLLEIPLILVIGNHDVKIRRLPANIHPVVFKDLGPAIRIVHDPKQAKGESLHLCGHLHPVVKIQDSSRSWSRMPCFLYRNHTLILPAFGSFTGGCDVKPEASDRIFTALREQVIELPKVLLQGSGVR